MVFLYHFWIVSISISGHYVALVSVRRFCISFVCHDKNAQSAQCSPLAPKSKLVSLYLCISPAENPGGGRCDGVRVFLRKVAMPCVHREELLSATACA